VWTCVSRARSILAAALLGACSGGEAAGTVVRFPMSGVGAEARILTLQLRRFAELYPEIRVEPQRTPDAADQRHQLYVQWLSAGVSDPDVLQLDVVWTAEFAAAGWLLPLDRFAPDVQSALPAALDASRWDGALYTLPWFVDVGMLYWRTDLLARPPRHYEELAQAAGAAGEHGVRYGLVWPAARYEGLVTVFLEYLTVFGGALQDSAGRIAVDSPAAVRALQAMCAAIESGGTAGRDVLTWHEEETRAAFQSGQALFMRNWPYAYPLLEDAANSAVAGRFAVAPMPPAAGGSRAAALGGALLAVNRHSDQPEAAYAVIEYLTRAEQMLERARAVGQYPPRLELYERGDLDGVLPISSAAALEILRSAVARPATPIYAQLSDLLQIELHRALSGQSEPATALAAAAEQMRALLERVELAPAP
jgi:ABC-type glycerol-3-phosphate transport system substrate-binding protein